LRAFHELEKSRFCELSARRGIGGGDATYLSLPKLPKSALFDRIPQAGTTEQAARLQPEIERCEANFPPEHTRFGGYSRF
jgi:hypothetical protein